MTLRIIERGGSIDLDPFRVTYVPLAHSIPEGNGLLIETPFGNIFHTGDWKIDETPVLGLPSSAETLNDIGDAGVLALVCDSTNVFQDNASGSEAGVRAGLLEAGAEGAGAGAGHHLRVQCRAARDARPGRAGDRAASTASPGTLRPDPQGGQSDRLFARFSRAVRFDEAMSCRKEVLIIATGGQENPAPRWAGSHSTSTS